MFKYWLDDEVGKVLNLHRDEKSYWYGRDEWTSSLIITTIRPVVSKDLLISPRFTPYEFLSRCKFSNLTARQPMVEFSLLHVPTLSVTEATTQILDLLMEPTGRGGLATLQQGGIGDLTR